MDSTIVARYPTADILKKCANLPGDIDRWRPPNPEAICDFSIVEFTFLDQPSGCSNNYDLYPSVATAQCGGQQVNSI